MESLDLKLALGRQLRPQSGLSNMLKSCVPLLIFSPTVVFMLFRSMRDESEYLQV